MNTTPYYQDDLVTLYHGDCREHLGGIEFDAIVSDPPYGMGYQHGARKNGVRLGFDEQKIVGDFEPFDPSHLIELNKPTILWGGNHFANRLPPSPGWLVWDKRDGRPANDQSDVELAWTNVLRTARAHSQYWNGATRKGREQSEGRLHVNQKPVALMVWCLGFIADTGAVIADFYAGSGSTLLAARELGRTSIGFEIEERNCEIIARRLDQGVLDFGESA